MTDRSTLQRNKAVLWARDLIGREKECVIAAGHNDTSSLSLHNIQGAELTSCSMSNDHELQALAARLVGKDVVLAGVNENVVRTLRERNVTVHDLLDYYKLFVNHPDAQLAQGVSSRELGIWIRDVLQKMAGSSLVLDQADTGAGKWTSAHFKPSPTMIEKLKSFIKN